MNVMIILFIVPPRPTQYLQEIMVSLVDQEECKDQRPEDVITENMICAENPGTDTCLVSFHSMVVCLSLLFQPVCLPKLVAGLCNDHLKFKV